MGTDWFYRGEFAERCTKHLQETGGILDRQDFGKLPSVESTTLGDELPRLACDRLSTT